MRTGTCPLGHGDTAGKALERVLVAGRLQAAFLSVLTDSPEALARGSRKHAGQKEQRLPRWSFPATRSGRCCPQSQCRPLRSHPSGQQGYSECCMEARKRHKRRERGTTLSERVKQGQAAPGRSEPTAALPQRGTCGWEGPARHCHLCRPGGLPTPGTPSPPPPLSSPPSLLPVNLSPSGPRLSSALTTARRAGVPFLRASQDWPLPAPSPAYTSVHHFPTAVSAAPPSSVPGSSGKELQPHTCTCHRQKVKVLPGSRVGVPLPHGNRGDHSSLRNPELLSGKARMRVKKHAVLPCASRALDPQ